MRPEIIESAFYLYRYTKDPRNPEMGRMFFEGDPQCLPHGGGGAVTGERGDLMASYFMAETLN